MATAFSHGLLGAVLLPLAPRQIPRLPLLAALVILPILPDLDVLAFSVGIPYSHPLGHRGFTHSLAFALLLGFAATLMFRRHCPIGTARWLGFGLLLSFAIASHGVLDAFTDAGHGVAFFWPFDNARYFFPWRPLATSPIGLDAFFNRDAWRILANEVVWIGPPLLVLAAISFGLRRALSSGRTTRKLG